MAFLMISGFCIMISEREASRDVVIALVISSLRAVSGICEKPGILTIAFSRTKYNPDLKRVDLVDIQYFAAECVNPPPGVKSLDWIKGGMQGAKCN